MPWRAVCPSRLKFDIILVSMNKFLVFGIISALTLVSSASWYWPFGSDEKDPPRLSELMEKTSLLIDEASDLASEGKVSESVAKYREALDELERVVAENPDRVNKPEFATVKTKRAYITAAIDSMLLSQARQNARAVAVSDTTELERKLAIERGEAVEPIPEPKVTEPKAEARQVEELPEVQEAILDEKVAAKAKLRKEKKKAKAKKELAPKKEVAPKKKATSKKSAKPKQDKPTLTPREQAIEAIEKGDFAAADLYISKLLDETPNNAMALNLRAVKEQAEGDAAKAEATLDQAIQSNPRDYHAYYNMAMLFLETNPGKRDAARRYYQTGRTFGGPEDPELEAQLK